MARSKAKSSSKTSPVVSEVVQKSPLTINKSPKSEKTIEDEAIEDTTLTQIHVQALDALVSVNSFFTGAVFIGLAVTTPGLDLSLVSACSLAGSSNLPKLILVWEVISFSSYLLSSLVAQGLKLLIVLNNSRKHDNVLSGGVNPRLLRSGMLVTAFGMVIGTVFLLLSILGLIQIRLGSLDSCPDTWNRWAAVPLVGFVSIGLFSFLSSLIYSFYT